MTRTINTRLNSLTAQRYLTRSQLARPTILQGLQTGRRMKTEKDGASSLAIVARPDRPLRGMNAAIRSKSDEIPVSENEEASPRESNKQQVDVKNQAASRELIEQADSAMEVANRIRAQILQESDIALATQANSEPQTVLKLLE